MFILHSHARRHYLGVYYDPATWIRLLGFLVRFLQRPFLDSLDGSECSKRARHSYQGYIVCCLCLHYSRTAVRSNFTCHKRQLLTPGCDWSFNSREF
jgi:hypothetical protein